MSNKQSKSKSGSKTAKKFIPSGKNSKPKTDIRNVIFKDINDDYAWGKYGNFKVIMMKENGYINATKLCAEATTKNGNKKELKHWKANTDTKVIMDEISFEVGIPHDQLSITITGGKLTIIRGTYVHPMLITPIANWISPKFAIRLGIWIEEWKNYSEENFSKYYDELANLEASQNSCKEFTIKNILKKKYKGKTEVPTEMGYIDLLTNNLLIEIKCYDNWKCALGQLIAYSIEYPNKKKCMYLFNVSVKKTSHIEKVCRLNNIKLMIYD